MSGFIRVRKTDPCPICGKPDWCMISRDRAVALCARISAGSFKKTKGGWCHRLTSPSPGMVMGSGPVRNFDKIPEIRRSSSSPTHPPALPAGGEAAGSEAELAGRDGARRLDRFLRFFLTEVLTAH
jgi:hypothetical protein